MAGIHSPIEQRKTGKGSPGAMARFDRPLNIRQQAVLDRLPTYDSRATVKRSDISMRDLATRPYPTLILRLDEFGNLVVEVTPHTEKYLAN